MLTKSTFSAVLAVIVLASHAHAQDYDYVSECPEDNGVFADAIQCDRYYECKQGEVSEQLCPDGLVFDESSHAFARCGFPFSVDCTGRPELQRAQPNAGCPRLNGYFAHPDPQVCDVFQFCSDGFPNVITCPGGLIFDPSLGQCGWSDQVKRKGCTSKDLYAFDCPNKDPTNSDHSRHADPEDCNTFYLCIGGSARRNGCGQGLVYNQETTSCERQETVEGLCKTWFNETYIESIFPAKPFQAVVRDSNSIDRKRPQAPEFQRRPRPKDPQEDIANLPPQLADLVQNSDLGFRSPSSQEKQSRPRPSINSVPEDSFNFEDGERISFLNSLKGRVEAQPQTLPTTTTRSPFTRPPKRKTEQGSRGQNFDNQPTEDRRQSSSQFSSFGSSASGPSFGSSASGSSFGSSASGPSSTSEAESRDPETGLSPGTGFGQRRRIPQGRVPSRAAVDREQQEVTPVVRGSDSSSNRGSVRGSDSSSNRGSVRGSVRQGGRPRPAARPESRPGPVSSNSDESSDLGGLGPSDLDFLLKQSQASRAEERPTEVPRQSDFVPDRTAFSSSSSTSSSSSSSLVSSSSSPSDNSEFGARRRVPITRGAIPRRQQSEEVKVDDQEIAGSNPSSQSRGSQFNRAQIRGEDSAGRSQVRRGGGRGNQDGRSQLRGGGGRREPEAVQDEPVERRPPFRRPEVAEEPEKESAAVSSFGGRSQPQSPSQESTDDTGSVSSSRQRSRLEVTRISLPPLRAFAEDETEFGSLPFAREQSRGRQSRRL